MKFTAAIISAIIGFAFSSPLHNCNDTKSMTAPSQSTKLSHTMIARDLPPVPMPPDDGPLPPQAPTLIPLVPPMAKPTALPLVNKPLPFKPAKSGKKVDEKGDKGDAKDEKKSHKRCEKTRDTKKRIAMSSEAAATYAAKGFNATFANATSM